LGRKNITPASPIEAIAGIASGNPRPSRLKKNASSGRDHEAEGGEGELLAVEPGQ
jgi:hypothetical protein